jgi:hypothetical protein
MPQSAKWLNSGFLNGFTVPKVAQKLGWKESTVWSQALINAN